VKTGPYQDRARRIIGSMSKVVQASKRRGPSSSDSYVGPGGREGLAAGFPVAGRMEERRKDRAMQMVMESE